MMDKCSSCGGEVSRIWVIDEVGDSPAVWHSGFRYTTKKPEVAWTGSLKVPVDGVVHAYCCSGCKQVFWLAHEGEHSTLVR